MRIRYLPGERVSRVAELLANSRDKDGLITDREMVALAVGMEHAKQIIIDEKAPTMGDEETADAVMRAFRIATILGHMRGRDNMMIGGEDVEDSQ